MAHFRLTSIKTDSLKRDQPWFIEDLLSDVTRLVCSKKTTPRGIGVEETFEIGKVPDRVLGCAVPPGTENLKTSSVHSHLSACSLSWNLHRQSQE